MNEELDQILGLKPSTYTRWIGFSNDELEHIIKSGGRCTKTPSSCRKCGMRGYCSPLHKFKNLALEELKRRKRK